MVKNLDRVGVIGLGYVGLPVSVAFAEAGFTVTGIDIMADRVNNLNQGISYIEDIPKERVSRVLKSGNFRATTDTSQLALQEAIIICVPTPLNKTHDPDLTAVRSVTSEVAKYLKKGQLIILESTTYPGTTEEILLSAFSENGLKVGEDFFLAFSPERIDPGSKGWRFENTPKVVGGVTPQCTQKALDLYGKVVEKLVSVSSPKVAEMTKIFENVFRVVNVALVNELALLSDRMGIEIWEVLAAANTKPYGIMNFTPGPGVGGHCIPIDPFYLTWKAREYDFNTRFIELAGEINLQMPYYVRELALRALNQKSRSLKDAQILILGVAYKRDISDYRESPSIKVIELLEQAGAKVSYHDPHIMELPVKEQRLKSVELTCNTLREADCVIIITDHSAFDYNSIVQEAQVVVDTRNATAGVNKDRHKIILL